MSLPENEKQNKEEYIPDTPLAFLRYASRSHVKWAVGGFIFVTLAQALSTSMPYIYKMIIDTAQSAAAGTADPTRVWLWGILYVVAISLMFAAWRLSGFTGMRWMVGLSATAYTVLFTYISKHSHAYFSNRFAGSLSSQIGHAASGAESLAEGLLWNYYSTVLSLVFTIAYMASVSLLATGLFVALILILVPLNVLLSKRRRKQVVTYSQHATHVAGRAVDSISNIGAVRQFVRRTHEVASFGKSVALMRASNLKQRGTSEWILVYNEAIVTVFEAAILFSVLYLWSQGAVSIGQLVMTFTLLMNVMGSLVFIGNSMNGFIRRYGEIEEGLSEVLLPHEIIDTPNAKKLEASEGKIEFRHVVFKYGEQEVFSDLELEIMAGQRIGIVGPSGAGKSTFVSLLLRQHELSGGEIYIDRQAIHEVTQDSLRTAMAVVPQEPLLFHRSIRENIAYGKLDATDEEVVETAKMAQAHDFIATLPSGYNTLVGERGVKLSGGQRQRIAIARAMLKNAPILILDEATSSLDSESEVAVQKALHTLMEGKTVIAIAHRLSTLREMDRILVIAEGKIVEDGTHTALLKKGGLYASLWEHQAGGFLQEE
jgi:ABC-type multidrug transport system fused ATPase/permease subunit